MNDDYRVSPQAYLARCRERLLEGTKQAIFYAAVEMRCCVEARQAEYFEHYQPLIRKRFQPYRLGENQKTVSKITSGDKIAQITFCFANGTSLRQFHTPVPLKLQKFVKQTVDGMRHSQQCYRPPDDPWWSMTRDNLVSNYRAAWIACRGEMPLPPLWNADSGEMHQIITYVTEENRAVMERFEDLKGMQLRFHVEYLDVPPADWVYDL